MSAQTLSKLGPLLIENGYRILPIQPGTKSPNTKNWTTIDAKIETLEAWRDEGKGNWGIGILGEETPGVDLDISDTAILEKVLDWSRKHIGVDNQRVGRAPRVLFACRSGKSFGKFRSKKYRSPDGNTHQIEILAKGSQYVAYAVHPDTQKPYTWTGADPTVWPADLLPELSESKAHELVSYFESIVPADWVPLERLSDGADHGVGNPAKTAALRDVSSALAAIKNPDLDYDDWIRLALAVKAAVGTHLEEGKQLFHEFSAQSSKYDADTTEEKWDSIREIKNIGAGTLFHIASMGNWQRPVSQASDDFDVIEIDEENEELPAKVLKTLDRDQMLAMPEPVWMVPGLLQKNTSALMFGKSNAFKSFVAIDIALSVATGTPWHGRPVIQADVLFVATEGANGVGRKRIPGWYGYYEVAIADQRHAHLYPAEISVDRLSHIDALIATIRYKKIGLLVLDIFGGTMDGTEVEDTTARAWTRGIQRIIRETGCTVLTVAHTGWADSTRARMHTHFWGGFDTRIKVEGDKAKLTCTVSIERHKDADSRGTWHFRMVPWLQSLVPVLQNENLQVISEADLNRPTRIALHALKLAVSDFGHIMVGPALPSTPVIEIEKWKQIALSDGMSESDLPESQKRVFNRAKSALLEKRLIKVEGDLAWPLID